MKTLLSVNVCFGLAIYSSAFAFAESGSRSGKFEISGGQTISCQVADAGPFPAAEWGPYKMNVAAFAAVPDDNNNTFLVYTFGLYIQKKAKPTHITVEDVSDEKAVTLVDDKKPQIGKKYWRFDTAPSYVADEKAHWLFDLEKETVRIFRITISAKDVADVILYQPARYSADAKNRIVCRLKGW